MPLPLYAKCPTCRGSRFVSAIVEMGNGFAPTELLEALLRWYRAKHHGTTEDEELQAELLATAYSKYLDAKTEGGESH